MTAQVTDNCLCLRTWHGRIWTSSNPGPTKHRRVFLSAHLWKFCFSLLFISCRDFRYRTVTAASLVLASIVTVSHIVVPLGKYLSKPTAVLRTTTTICCHEPECHGQNFKLCYDFVSRFVLWGWRFQGRIWSNSRWCFPSAPSLSASSEWGCRPQSLSSIRTLTIECVKTLSF